MYGRPMYGLWALEGLEKEEPRYTCSIVELILDHRPRRWTNIQLTVGQHLVFAGQFPSTVNI